MKYTVYIRLNVDEQFFKVNMETVYTNSKEEVIAVSSDSSILFEKLLNEFEGPFYTSLSSIIMREEQTDEIILDIAPSSFIIYGLTINLSRS